MFLIRVRRLVLAAAVLVAAACDSSVLARPNATAVGGDPRRGADLIYAYGCGACHQVPGASPRICIC